MSNALHLQSVPIICSHCGHPFEQPLAWLQDHPSFRCPKCDGEISLSLPSDDSDTAIGDALKRLGRPIRR